jgi:hypothetical protein
VQRIRPSRTGSDLSAARTADFSIGSPNYPAATRFYIQGKPGQDAFRISNKSLLGAFFYAAEGPVGASDSLEVFGGIIAGSFHNSAATSIHYDRAVLAAGDECNPKTSPDGGVPTQSPDASPPPTCGSCLDCNNQACVNGACGACTDSSQCCAPLYCSDGQCVMQIIL